MFINTSSPTKEIFAEFIACICKKLPALEELYLGTDKWFEKSEELGRASDKFETLSKSLTRLAEMAAKDQERDRHMAT